MPGTLFLDALEKKKTLAKGYPLGEGRIVKEQGFGVGHGSNSDSYPGDSDLYRTPSLLGRAIGRLQESVKPQTDPNRPGRHNIENRMEAESAEGLRRNPNSIINQGVKKKAK